ncbi:hypothetical protein HXW87_17035 [Pseudomonas sp. Y5-11]|uniref:Ig-like domain-containing protein n=1 Tax=Pseudomonas sp. Y5-11 TaxID=2749808 RepID=UPI001EFB0374|nr:Ig-like domain-containing protein [Pseudomonas sp. Y5-11]ULN83812.1 hypothetical protein HXW87_17035 [Pseudomonas sp. Y5-11]
MSISAPIIDTPENGASMQTTSVVRGRGKPNCKVTVNQSGTGYEWGVGWVDSRGIWEIQLTLAADPNETYWITARQFDSDGTPSGWANNVSFKVVDGDFGVNLSSSIAIQRPQSGEITPLRPLVEGTATPRAEIQLYEAGSGNPVGRPVYAGEDGRWSAVYEAAIVPWQQYGVTAKQRGKNGSESDWADNVYFTVELIVQGPPVIQRPDRGSFVDPNPEISGMAKPYAKVELYKSYVGTLLGTTYADQGGNWSIRCNEASVRGEKYEVTATQSGTNGQSGWAENVSFTVNRSAPGNVTTPPEIRQARLGVDQLRKTIIKYTGTAIPVATVTLYDIKGSKVLGTTTAGQDGSWNIGLYIENMESDQDQYRVYATQAGTDGVQSSRSNEWTFPVPK